MINEKVDENNKQVDSPSAQTGSKSWDGQSDGQIHMPLWHLAPN